MVQTTYSLEIAQKLCDQIASWPYSLKRLCDSDDAFPSLNTVYSWLNRHTEFRQMYAQAKALQADHLAEQIIEIADESSTDIKLERNGAGTLVAKVDTQVIARAKLMIEARRHVAASLAPNKWGKKMDVTSGGQPLAPQLTDEQRVARFAELQRLAQQRANAPKVIEGISTERLREADQSAETSTEGIGTSPDEIDPLS